MIFFYVTRIQDALRLFLATSLLIVAPVRYMLLGPSTTYPLFESFFGVTLMEILLVGTLIVGQVIFLYYQHKPRRQLLSQADTHDAFMANLDATGYQWLRQKLTHSYLWHSTARPVAVKLSAHDLEIYCSIGAHDPQLVFRTAWASISLVSASQHAFRRKVALRLVDEPEALVFTVISNKLAPTSSTELSRIVSSIEMLRRSAEGRN